jgi:hypothetical protein
MAASKRKPDLQTDEPWHLEFTAEAGEKPSEISWPKPPRRFGCPIEGLSMLPRVHV